VAGTARLPTSRVEKRKDLTVRSVLGEAQRRAYLKPKKGTGGEARKYRGFVVTGANRREQEQEGGRGLFWVFPSNEKKKGKKGNKNQKIQPPQYPNTSMISGGGCAKNENTMSQPEKKEPKKNRYTSGKHWEKGGTDER